MGGGGVLVLVLQTAIREKTIKMSWEWEFLLKTGCISQ